MSRSAAESKQTAEPKRNGEMMKHANVHSGCRSRLTIDRRLAGRPYTVVERRVIRLSTYAVFLAGVLMAMLHWQQAVAAGAVSIHYDALLEETDRRLQANITLAEQRPDSWTQLEKLATLYLERARLTGDFDNFVDARRTLEEAFSVADTKAGPFLVRAMVNFATHRLPAVEDDLVSAEQALLVDAKTRESILGLRADVQLYSAEYSKAKDSYEQLETTYPSVSSATRMSHYYAQLANYPEAEKWLETAEQRVRGSSAHLRAWLKLQSGILDLERGQWDQALAHYQAGLTLLPGFWLLEEHIAEIQALQGQDKVAEAAYRDLIERTGSPLFMSALADILGTRPPEVSQNESRRWQQMARSVYESQLAVLPEAAAGHALYFFLQDDDPLKALQLAKSNYQQRPGGQAALRLIQAHVSLGQLQHATSLLDSLLASPYRSADLHATAGVIYRFQKESDKAHQHESQARAINPAAIADMDWLRFKLGES